MISSWISRSSCLWLSFIGDPEDHLQDDLEGERAHPFVHRERDLRLPPRRLGGRELGDHRPVVAKSLPVERGHEQPA